jgi:hypothetical protein
MVLFGVFYIFLDVFYFKSGVAMALFVVDVLLPSGFKLVCTRALLLRQQLIASTGWRLGPA